MNIILGVIIDTWTVQRLFSSVTKINFSICEHEALEMQSAYLIFIVKTAIVVGLISIQVLERSAYFCDRFFVTDSLY